MGTAFLVRRHQDSKWVTFLFGLLQCFKILGGHLHCQHLPFIRKRGVKRTLNSCWFKESYRRTKHLHGDVVVHGSPQNDILMPWGELEVQTHPFGAHCGAAHSLPLWGAALCWAGTGILPSLLEHSLMGIRVGWVPGAGAPDLQLPAQPAWS